MSKLGAALKTNLIYGLIVLIPLAIIALLLAQLVEITDAVAEPLAEAFGLESVGSVALALFLSIVLLFVFCVLVGAAVRTKIGSVSFEKLERTVLKQIPGYPIINRVLKGFAKETKIYPPALVRLSGPEGAGAICFVMEDPDSGPWTVFVPSTPAMTVGMVYLVEPELVVMLDATPTDVAAAIGQWGIGLSEVLGDPREID